MRANPLDSAAFAAIITGAVNWGLVGFFKLDLIEAIFAEGAISRTIYGVIGFAGLYALGFYRRIINGAPNL